MEEKIITIQINGEVQSEANTESYFSLSFPELDQALSEGYKVKEIIDLTPPEGQTVFVMFHLKKSDKNKDKH